MTRRISQRSSGSNAGAPDLPPEAAAAAPAYRDRIVDFKRVRASQIVGAPWNWRSHPTAQRDAVTGSLEELGIYLPLCTRQLEDGRYQLIDGHLRKDLYIAVRSGRYLPIAGDEGPYDPTPLLQLGREQIIFGGHYFARSLPESRCWLVWDKENGDGSFGDAELAWASHDRAIKLYRWKWNGLVREGSRSIEGLRRMHPTQKPVGLFKAILLDFSSPGDVIADPFLGAGATLLAAELTERTCRGAELEPTYVAVDLERWSSITGRRPERVS